MSKLGTLHHRLASSIIVVDEAQASRQAVKAVLTAEGYQRVRLCASVEDFYRELSLEVPHVVITGLSLCDHRGMSVMRAAHRHRVDLPVVLIVSSTEARKADESAGQAAFGVLQKPIVAKSLLEVLERALDASQGSVGPCSVRRYLSTLTGMAATLLGESNAVRDVRRMVAKLAPTLVNVIIEGETGTGKEVVAGCLHDASGRSGPLVAVNCAAIPRDLFESELFGHEAGAFTGAQRTRIGKIEYAHGGTLFLDEVEYLPLDLQAKLLRVLQERSVVRLGSNRSTKVDLRVIAATKQDLRRCCLEERFRADLYFRLNVASVRLPPLRERKADIPMLLWHFLSENAEAYPVADAVVVSPETTRWLLSHDWPGNVRELANVAQQLHLGLPVISLGMAAAASVSCTLEQHVARFERGLIESAIERHQGLMQAVSAELAISPATLYRKIKALRIPIPRNARGLGYLTAEQANERR